MKKNKKKVKDDNFIIINDKKVYYDDLRAEVNAMDKAFGLRLKHPDIYAEPHQYYQVMEAQAQMYSAGLICVFNGIDLGDYFETDELSGYGTICKPVGIMHPVFRASSALNWDGRSKYGHKSLMFRCRFLTEVLFEVMCNIDRITKRETKEKFTMKHSFDEQRIIVCKKVMDDCSRLVKLMITPKKEFKNSLLIMQEHVSYTMKNVNHQNLKKKLNSHVLNLRHGTKKDPFTQTRLLSDDIIINDLLEIAYMLATNRTDIKNLPKFKFIEGATVNHNLVKLITHLGDAILRAEHDTGFNRMFRAYINARPRVYSDFANECNNDLRVLYGCVALGFASFVMNDKFISSFVDEMMRKGK